MASVYLATHVSLGRFVALKLLRKFENTNQTKRFIREGQILATLHHNSIITIFDIGVTESEQPYISMEYLEGGDLEARIQKGMSAKEALKVVEAISDCLSIVHNEGIIHRDIKPANILFHKNGTPILSDFGIAKQENRDTQLTMEGSAFGSPYYLSPEQAECKTLDGRTDIYGLGIVLYEMLTGQKPYKGNSHIETIVAHMSDELPELPPELSQYQEMVHRMIAKLPIDRFSTTGDVVEYIQKLRESETKVQTTQTESKQKESPNSVGAPKITGARQNQQYTPLSRTEKSMWSLAGTLLITLIIAGIYIWNQQHDYIHPAQIAEFPNSVPEQSPVKDHIAIDINHNKAGDSEALHIKPRLNTEDKPITSLNKAERINEYLSKADHALKDFRLVNPKKDNAEYYYKQVLSIEHKNKYAIDGFKKIANTYADLAEGELNRFNYTQANRFIHKGLRIQPDNKRLLRLRDNSDVFTDAPKRAFGKIKSIFK